MQLRTLLVPQTISKPFSTWGAGFPTALGGRVSIVPCPEAERVIYNENPCLKFPIQLHFAAGVARACDEGFRSGKRLCSLRIEPLNYHEILARAECVRYRSASFVLGKLWNCAVPIEPVPPAWMTRAVLDVARSCLDDGHSGYLPILADALEEAGCDHPLILTHLRTCADHGARCWVLDLLLGTGPS
jgi:hypothetical protein